MDANTSYNIPVDKLMYWKVDNWLKYDNKRSDIILRLYCDQILILNNNKVLESLNTNEKIKGFYKGDVLILIICSENQEVRKLKFQIKSNTAQHFKKLGEHFPVVSHKNASENLNNLQYRRVDDVFKSVLEEYKGNAGKSNLPTNFGDFVKICLLDPAFPQVVHETMKILECEIIKKT